MRKLLFTLMAVLTLTAASCSKNKIYPVSGKVMYRDAPATGAAVFFYAHGKEPLDQHTIMGIVGEDGTFELVCDALGKGAPPGDYDVVIQWRAASRQGKGRGPLPDRLRGRYADLKRPLLQATVQARTNHLPPFDLTDE